MEESEICQPIKRQRKQQESETSIIMPMDTELAISSLSKMSEPYHGFVLLHQIYGILSSRSLVDEQLETLRIENKKYRIFNCGMINPSQSNSRNQTNESKIVIMDKVKFINDFKVIHSKEYGKSNVKQSFNLIEHLFLSFIDTNSQICVLKSDLQDLKIDDHFLIEESINYLLDIGFLQLRPEVITESSSVSTNNVTNGKSNIFLNNTAYWVSHPLLGSFKQSLRSAENQIIMWIRSTRYKEIAQKSLIPINSTDSNQKQMSANQINSIPNVTKLFQIGSSKSKKTAKAKFKLKNTRLSVEYHLLDLIGRNIIYKVPNASETDFIIRLSA